MCSPYVSVIIAAAGNSSRMGKNVSKQLLDISNNKVIEFSLKAFSNSEYVKEIVISTKKEEVEIISQLKKTYPKLTSIVEGGKVRQESVKKALNVLNKNSEFVAIHDAARPLITTEDIDKIIKLALSCGAVCPVSKVVDTVKIAEDGTITDTINRDTVFLASTPQVFKTDLYKQCVSSLKDTDTFTDDCSLVEKFGYKVKTYVMERDNTKITTPKDFKKVKNALENSTPSIRIGHGYDVHRLATDRDLILGGVKIPHSVGLLGHSDADVLTHAIIDSLLGAASLGDIGKHFPDSDEKYKGISSMKLLFHVKNLLDEHGYKVSNLDATIIAQEPKLSPFIKEMTKNIINVLGVEENQVNVKATTEEKLGFTGEKLGISAHCVSMIYKE